MQYVTPLLILMFQSITYAQDFAHIGITTSGDLEITSHTGTSVIINSINITYILSIISDQQSNMIMQINTMNSTILQQSSLLAWLIPPPTSTTSISTSSISTTTTTVATTTTITAILFNCSTLVGGSTCDNIIDCITDVTTFQCRFKLCIEYFRSLDCTTHANSFNCTWDTTTSYCHIINTTVPCELYVTSTTCPSQRCQFNTQYASCYGISEILPCSVVYDQHDCLTLKYCIYDLNQGCILSATSTTITTLITTAIVATTTTIPITTSVK